jgi:hypothetical protein
LRDNRLQRGLGFLSHGQISRAKRTLLSKPAVDLADPARRQQISDLFPPMRNEVCSTVADYGAGIPLAVSVPNIEEGIRALKTGAGVGAEGMSNELLKKLMNKKSPHFQSILDGLQRFANFYASGLFPDWFYTLAVTMNVCGIFKDDELNDFRPIGIQHALRKLIKSCLMQPLAPAAAEHLFPVQLAIGVPNGGSLLASGVREHMALHPEHHLHQGDIAMCHQYIDRHLAMEALAGCPRFSHLAPLVFSELRSAAPVYFRGSCLDFVTSRTGGQQGCPLMTFLASLVMRSAQIKLNNTLSSAGGFARWQSDDSFAVGPPGVLWVAVGEYQQDLKKLFLKVRPEKEKVFVAKGFETDDIPAGLKYSGRLTGVVVDGVAEFAHGITVNGIPIGEEGYVSGKFKDVLQNTVSDIQQLKSTLGSAHSHALHTLHYYSLNNQVYHWLAGMYFEDVHDLLPPLQSELDDVSRSVTGSYCGISPILDGDFSAKRWRQPVRLGGSGLRALQDVAPAAFLGNIWAIIGRLIDHVDERGALVRGYFPSLEPLLGRGSFNVATSGAGRLTHLLNKGGRLADSYSSAYNLVAKDLVSPGNPQSADGLLGARIEDSGFGSVQSKGQHQLTVARENARAASLDADAKALAKDDMRRVSYFSVKSCKTASMLLTSWPGADFNLSGPQFTDAVRNHFGAPPTRVIPFIGNKLTSSEGLEVTYRHGHRKGQVKVCDEFGRRLVSSAVDGDDWRKRHDSVKSVTSGLLRDMGLNCQEEVYNLFASANSPAANSFFNGVSSTAYREW